MGNHDFMLISSWVELTYFQFVTFIAYRPNFIRPSYFHTFAKEGILFSVFLYFIYQYFVIFRSMILQDRKILEIAKVSIGESLYLLNYDYNYNLLIKNIRYIFRQRPIGESDICQATGPPGHNTSEITAPHSTCLCLPDGLGTLQRSSPTSPLVWTGVAGNHANLSAGCQPGLLASDRAPRNTLTSGV